MRIKNYLAVLSLLVGCGSDHAASSADAGADAQPDAAPDSPSGPAAVTFSYTPSWSGVTEVDVIGGFGQSNDWTSPLVTLMQSGNTWTGSYQLPAGQYLYLFHVVGDADAGSKAATFERYVVDPAQSGYMLCPK